MVVYELSHIFFRCANKLVSSAKNLGLYHSYESIKQAVQYFCTQPGFCENKDAFSIKERVVLGAVVKDIVYEVIVYLHTEDYEFEVEIELGLYGDEMDAQNSLAKYCIDNAPLVNVETLVVERIINKYTLERKEWIEGFSIY